MKSLLGFALAQAPRLYAGLLRRRPDRNAEKLVFLAVVRRGDVVFDVGANTGYYTLLFSHLVGRRGAVHAFEPVPETFAALRASLARHRRFDNLHLNPWALGDREAVLPLFVPDADYGQASLARHRAGSWEGAREVRSHECRMTTLDGYLRQHPGAAPAFVKCDVEGAERLVLAGGTDALRRFSPLLHLEVNPDWTRTLGYEPADLVRFLADFGYTRYHLVADGVRPLADPMGELRDLAGSANLLCSVPGRHDERLDRLAAAAPLRR